MKSQSPFNVQNAKSARERAQRIRDARLDEARLAELERRAGCMDADASEDESD